MACDTMDDNESLPSDFKNGMRKYPKIHPYISSWQYEIEKATLTVKNLFYFIFVVHNIHDDSDTDATDRIEPDASMSDYDFESYQDDLQHRTREQRLRNLPLSTPMGNKSPICVQKKNTNLEHTTRRIRQDYCDDDYLAGNTERQWHEKEKSSCREDRRSVDLDAVYTEIAEINAKLKVLLFVMILHSVSEKSRKYFFQASSYC